MSAATKRTRALLADLAEAERRDATGTAAWAALQAVHAQAVDLLAELVAEIAQCASHSSISAAGAETESENSQGLPERPAPGPQAQAPRPARPEAWHRRIDDLVAAAPELTDEHRAKLAALLGGGASR